MSNEPIIYSHTSLLPDYPVVVSIRPIKGGKKHALNVGPGGVTLHASTEDLKNIETTIREYLPMVKAA